ncbi:unnamed protein product [Urochloa humidicola]
MIDKIKVNLDFHIFDILDLDLLLCSPIEELLDKSHGSLDGRLREATSATTTSCLANPMAKPLPKLNPFESMMHGSPFTSSEPILFEVAVFALKEYEMEETLHLCEDERPSSPSNEFEPLPTGPYCVFSDHDRKATSSFHDESLEIENPWAIEDCATLTLESRENV